MTTARVTERSVRDTSPSARDNVCALFDLLCMDTVDSLFMDTFLGALLKKKVQNMTPGN